MKRNLILFAIIAIISSCGSHYGTMSGNASISNANFRIVDIAVGTSISKKVFGLGGLKNEAMVLEAKRNLYSSYPLVKGQALANVTVDFVRKNYFFYEKIKVTVSAEVVDFNQDSDEYNLAEINEKLSGRSLLEKFGFLMHDKVYVKVSNSFVRGEIKKMLQNEAVVKLLDDEKEINVGYSKLIKVNVNNTDSYSYKKGTSVTFKIRKNYNKFIHKYGEIIDYTVNDSYIT